MKLQLNLFKVLLLLLAIALLPGLVACDTQEMELPFQTVGHALTPGTGQSYAGKDPMLDVIAKEDEINALGGMISPESQAQLPSLDFSQYLAIAVFQGMKPSSGYSVEVTKVTRAGSTVIVYAHFTERDPRQFAQDIVTSPYHLIQIQTSQLHGQVEFVLNADGKVVARQSRSLS